MNITREHFDKLEPIDGEAAFLGTLYIFGTPYHFLFVEVVEKDSEFVAVDDPYDRLDDIGMIDPETRYLPTEIDGKLYVGCATPFGD